VNTAQRQGSFEKKMYPSN